MYLKSCYVNTERFDDQYYMQYFLTRSAVNISPVYKVSYQELPFITA